MREIKLIISDDSDHAIADVKVDEWYHSVLRKSNPSSPVEVHVATTVMFAAIRLGIRRKEIAPTSFDYNGQTIEIDEGANLTPVWPDGLFDNLLDLVRAIAKG